MPSGPFVPSYWLHSVLVTYLLIGHVTTKNTANLGY